MESNPKEVRYCPEQAAPWVYTTLSLWLMTVCSLQLQVHSSSSAQSDRHLKNTTMWGSLRLAPIIPDT